MCQRTMRSKVLKHRQNVKGTHSQWSRQGNSVSERKYFCHHPKELSQSEIVRRSNLEWKKKQVCRRNLENRAISISIGSKASERNPTHNEFVQKTKTKNLKQKPWIENALDRTTTSCRNCWHGGGLQRKEQAKQLEILRQAKKPDAEMLFQQGYQQLELFHHQLKQQLLYLEAHMNVNQGGATFCTSIHSKGCFFIFILGSRILDCIARLSKQLQAKVICTE